jgi:hypothetical protein
MRKLRSTRLSSSRHTTTKQYTHYIQCIYTIYYINIFSVCVCLELEASSSEFFNYEGSSLFPKFSKCGENHHNFQIFPYAHPKYYDF